MKNVIIIIGIIIGVAWRIAMPFFRRVLDGKLSLDEFDWQYVYEGAATLLFAVPLGAILFFKFVPPNAPDLGIFLSAFVWGYGGQNLTNGGPPWIRDLLLKLGLIKKDNPNNPGNPEKLDNPGHGNPGNPGNPNPPTNRDKIVDWMLGRNGQSHAKRVEARLELVVFAPIQFFFLTALWDFTQAVGREDWVVASRLFDYILPIAALSIALLWGRNIRSWIGHHMTDYLTDRQKRKAQEVEFRAKLKSTEGVIQSIQDAVTLVSHGQQLLESLPKIPIVPKTTPPQE
ncbi:hypothetical protein ES703_22099 [subsurface metagenome]